MNSLALALQREKKLREAEVLFRRAIDIAIGRRAFGDNHPLTAVIILSLSEIAAGRGRAEQRFESLLAGVRRLAQKKTGPVQ